MHSKELRRWRLILRLAQRDICPICGDELGEDQDCNIDHVLARSRGGFDGIGNLLLTHILCNYEKASALPTGCLIVWLVAVDQQIRIPVILMPGQAWRPSVPQKKSPPLVVG